jgi:hypothetical protein
MKALLFLCCLCSGCYTLTSTGIGAPAPMRSPCKLRVEPITPKDAEARYRQVGVVCVAAGDAFNGNDSDFNRWDDSLKSDFQVRACQVGGDVVVKAGLCAAARPMSPDTTPGILFNVYRDGQ